ncbi:MAG: hypothetical protein EOO21_00015 [Comamonadaceae bacterium]|nr:MAG: hypothetical protein EOO21_00015 [Comamonadaceae bacterium]
MNLSPHFPPKSSLYRGWDECLEADELRLVDRAREFSKDVLAPLLARGDDNAALTKVTLKLWAQAGLQGMQTPKALNGHGASYMTKIRVVMEVARHSFSVAFALNNSHSMVHMVATRAPQAIRERYLEPLLKGDLVASVALTEPRGGSDLAAMQTHARKAEGGWLVNGSKSWVTNSTITDLVVVAAQTAEGTKGIGRFLIPMSTAGVSRLGAHELAAGGAAGSGAISFDNVFVPDANMLETPGEGFKKAMESINAARVHVAAMAVAVLEGALSQAVRYCSERHAFGKALLEHQGLRWQLVEVASQLEAANQLVFHAANIVQRGGDASLASAHAKKFASSVAVAGVEQCMQAMGAASLFKEAGLARQLAEVKAAAYADGSTEILNERIGSNLLKNYA